jgi:hypothetical protein
MNRCVSCGAPRRTAAKPACEYCGTLFPRAAARREAFSTLPGEVVEFDARTHVLVSGQGWVRITPELTERALERYLSDWWRSR